MEANEQLVREENTLLLQQNAILKAELQKLKMQGIDKTDPPPTDPLFPQPTSVCRVAIKLPPFWPDRPAIWFAQVEAQFSSSGISADLTKFNYVIAQLDTRVIGEVEDIILQPPPEDKYGRLKSELIRRLSTSEEQRVRQLVSDVELGNRRPSQFLRYLRSLAGKTLTDENLLRQLWMRRLPQHLQAILAAQSELSLDKVAELADKILEVSPGMVAPYSSAVFSASTSAVSPRSLEDITRRQDEVSRQLAVLTAERGRNRTRDFTNQRRRSQTPGKLQMCFYHRKFNTKAVKCIQPCTWTPPRPSENDKSSQ
ncbi:uncharacterized protein LOC119630332 [Bombyx mori]|uniref:DUF7041 domain-containing protein n=1 Tax=Bombyx mori TaxID=7091 RepID=A0A8R2M8Q4_BOMMO|nr:uncharacterized protein LOC119630332 [Bombyx mori]